MQPVLLKDHLSAPNRARRPNNAIFVNLDDKTIPTEPLEAAVMSSKKICVHPNDVKAEQQLRQVSIMDIHVFHVLNQPSVREHNITAFDLKPKK